MLPTKSMTDSGRITGSQEPLLNNLDRSLRPDGFGVDPLLALQEGHGCAVEPPLTFGHAILREVAERLATPDAQVVMDGVRQLRDCLAAIRSAASEAEWRQFMARHFRQHPAFRFALEDPCIRRAFEKPRGYPGDAVVMDFIYQDRANAALLRTASSRGRWIAEPTTNFLASRAVRNRRYLLQERLRHLGELPPPAQSPFNRLWALTRSGVSVRHSGLRRDPPGIGSGHRKLGRGPVGGNLCSDGGGERDYRCSAAGTGTGGRVRFCICLRVARLPGPQSCASVDWVDVYTA